MVDSQSSPDMPENVAPLPKESRCWLLDFCICTNPGRFVHKLWLRAESVMKMHFAPAERKRLLSHGLIALLWSGFLEDGEWEPGKDVDLPDEQYVSYVALQYWKPWRPTFVSMIIEHPDAAEHGVPLNLSVLRNGGEDDWASHITLAPETFERKIVIMSPHELVAEFNLQCRWEFQILSLSTSSRPFPRSVGKVRAWPSSGRHVVWQGLVQENRILNRQGRWVGDADAAGEPPDEREEGGLDEAPADIQEDAEMAEVWALLDNLDNGNQDCASSVSSSSRSRSSSWSRSHSASSSTSQHSVPHAVAPRDDLRDEAAQPARDVEQGLGAHGRRAQHELTHLWSPREAFLFTFKPARGASAAGWQVTCKYHGAAAESKCTKSLSFHTEAQRRDVERRLKFWCLSATQHPDKESHGRGRGLPRQSDEQLARSDEWLDVQVALMPAPL